jgi:hypothetical protein
MTRDSQPSRSVSRRSRRRFLKLVAASSVAALAASAGASPLVAATTPPARKSKTPGPAVRAEIKSQKESLDKALKVIREYSLPPGSEMSLVFVPIPRAAADDREKSR